jgi:cyanoexosortase A
MNGLKLINELKFWLLGTGMGLIAIHLNSTWKYGNIDLLGASILFWLAISSLLKEKWDALSLESDPLSSFVGASLIAWILLKSALLPGDDLFLRLSPFVGALGLGLLASGVKGLKHYRKELLLLSFLAVPPGLFSRIIDLPTLTAKFVTSILWYLGFQVSRSGVHVILPRGSVEVDYGCSGTAAILQLLGLAFLFLAMFPTNWKQKILVPIVAVLIAFSVNGVRISILAFLVSFSRPEVFEYWHQGQGSLIFSFISAIIFGVLCHFLLLQNESKSKDSMEV